ncbi:MAG: ribonuclease P protein component [Melioribacteraceae bacterium]|nr:ribonuclease P protein component [Melioribacteraceae bacterium]MCO6474640.1 ribonuclease P protein component [Melioribacteraceae bacterium]MDD3558511.1 ribonuclease P protein component [Melioribacteraceae bacterium]
MKSQGLSKKERIKSKKEFQRVYSEGNTLFSPRNSIKAIYLIVDDKSNPGIRVAFAVHKKAGKAVWRNRMKRLLRETYRLNKNLVLPKVVDSGKRLFLVFSPNSLNEKDNKKIHLNEVMPEVLSILNKLAAQF